MTFRQAILTCFRKYFTFSGRASRSEYWWFILFLAIISSLIQSYTQSGDRSIAIKFGLNFKLDSDAHWMENAFTALTFIPFIAVLTRRLHDFGKPGYMSLAWLIVVVASAASFLILPWQIGALAIAGLIAVAIYFLTRPSQPGTNQYGPNPYEVPT